MTDLKLPQKTIEHLAAHNFKNEVNMYICERVASHRIITVDLDAGVTPAFLACAGRGNEHCKSTMRSTFYPGWPVPEPFREVPLFMWYRPSQEEFNAMSPSMQDHVRQGGLELRPAHADEKIDLADGLCYIRGKKLT